MLTGSFQKKQNSIKPKQLNMMELRILYFAILSNKQLIKDVFNKYPIAN